MLVIVTPRPCEAKGLIRRLNLKRGRSNAGREIFLSDDTILAISGIGILKTCAALSALIENIKEVAKIHALHFGGSSSDRSHAVGEILLAHKVTDALCGKSYYPDMLYRHNFQEASLLTVNQDSEQDQTTEEAEIVDTEASGFCEAASAYLSPSQISLLKIVRNDGDNVIVSDHDFASVIEEKMNQIFDYIDQIKRNSHSNFSLEPDWQREIRLKLEKNLRLTVYQRNSLSKLLLPHSHRADELLRELEPFLDVEASSKSQQRETFERIKELLIA